MWRFDLAHHGLYKLLSIAFILGHAVPGLNIEGLLVPYTLKVSKELLVSASLDHIKLMWVPELREDRFDVMLMHAEYLNVFLCTTFADESPIRDVGMRGCLLLAVDAVSIELIVYHHFLELLLHILRLLLSRFRVKLEIVH